MKPILSNHISLEQFAFLKDRQIHEVVGTTQEVIHTLHSRRGKGMILKVDLSKAFDRVNWLYIRIVNSFRFSLLIYQMDHELHY